MIRICSYCGRKFGEVEPLENKDKTHGICPGCEWVVFAKLDLEEALRKMPDSTGRSIDEGFDQLGLISSMVYQVLNIESFRKTYCNKQPKIRHIIEQRRWTVRIIEWFKNLVGWRLYDQSITCSK